MTATVVTLRSGRLADLHDGYARLTQARRRTTLLCVAIAGLVFLLSALQAEVDLVKFLSRIDGFTSYIERIFHLSNGKPVHTDVAEWFWGWRYWSRLLAESLLIAYLGTVIGVLGGFILCFLAASNLMPRAVVRVLARRYLEFCRTVPELVFALIFVVAFGLGPVPGVLALAIHTTGAMGKLFAEVVENIDMNPVEGVAASGGSWTQQIRFGVLPQVLSNFVSYALLRFEINVRGSTVMGFVGAGGIGHELLTSIRRFQYSDVSAILIMIVIAVMVIDLVTERLRHALLRAEDR